MVLHIQLIEQGPIAGRKVAINQPEFLIGRAIGCDLRLPMSAVSRHHCLIRIQSGDVNLVDLGSSNGTHVNGQLVVGSARLRPGDRLRVGTCQFVVEMNNPDTLSLGEPDTPGPSAG